MLKIIFSNSWKLPSLLPGYVHVHVLIVVMETSFFVFPPLLPGYVHVLIVAMEIFFLSWRVRPLFPLLGTEEDSLCCRVHQV